MCFCEMSVENWRVKIAVMKVYNVSTDRKCNCKLEAGEIVLSYTKQSMTAHSNISLVSL